jgi:hypothetical protein
MKSDEKLAIQEKMKIDQKEFNVLKENQMVKLLIEVEKMSSPVFFLHILDTHQLRKNSSEKTQRV